MTEEQRKAAIMALDTLSEWANKCRSVYVPDITALKTRVLEALQSPPVPVIEGLEGTIQYLIMVANSHSRQSESFKLNEEYSIAEAFKQKSHMLFKHVKALEEYSKLQKGE